MSVVDAKVIQRLGCWCGRVCLPDKSFTFYSTPIPIIHKKQDHTGSSFFIIIFIGVRKVFRQKLQVGKVLVSKKNFAAFTKFESEQIKNRMSATIFTLQKQKFNVL